MGGVHVGLADDDYESLLLLSSFSAHEIDRRIGLSKMKKTGSGEDTRGFPTQGGAENGSGVAARYRSLHVTFG